MLNVYIVLKKPSLASLSMFVIFKNTLWHETITCTLFFFTFGKIVHFVNSFLLTLSYHKLAYLLARPQAPFLLLLRKF